MWDRGVIYQGKSLGQRADLKPLVWARSLGIYVIVGILGAAVFVKQFESVLSAPTEAVEYARLALLLATGWLLWAWVWATGHELAQLAFWLDPVDYGAPFEQDLAVLVFALAATLGTLLLTARMVQWYAAVFALYAAANVVGSRRLLRELSAAIGESKVHLSEEREGADGNQNDVLDVYERAVAAVDLCYLGKPWMLHAWIVFWGSLLCCGLAWYAWLRDSELLLLASYACMAGLILAMEVWIYRWRQARDQELRACHKSLNALLRKKVASAA